MKCSACAHGRHGSCRAKRGLASCGCTCLGSIWGRSKCGPNGPNFSLRRTIIEDRDPSAPRVRHTIIHLDKDGNEISRRAITHCQRKIYTGGGAWHYDPDDVDSESTVQDIPL